MMRGRWTQVLVYYTSLIQSHCLVHQRCFKPNRLRADGVEMSQQKRKASFAFWVQSKGKGEKMLGALRLPASLELVHFATNGESLHIRIFLIPLLHIKYRLAYVVLLKC